MQIVNFKDFFNEIKNDLFFEATKSIKMNFKEISLDIKFANNINKYILNIKDEEDLSNLFSLHYNSMYKNKDEVKDPKKISETTLNILNELDGVSTHMIKYPEASLSAGQIYKKKKKETSDIKGNLFVNSENPTINGKFKLYSKNATTMKYARPFSSDFLMNDNIISFLEIFSEIEKYPFFYNQQKIRFGDDLNLIKDKCLKLLDGNVDVDFANTIITLPITNRYLNIIPVCSVEMLNKIQFTYLNYKEDKSFYNPDTRISVGGANAQNVSDYCSNIGGFQKVLISSVPKISITEYKKLQNKLIKLDDRLINLIYSNKSYINSLKKDEETNKKISIFENMLTLESLENYQIEYLKKSIILENLIKRYFNNIETIINNFEFIIEDFDLNKIKNMNYIIFLMKSFDKDLILQNEEQNLILINHKESYNSLTFNEKLEIKNSIINSIYNKLIDDFSNILNNKFIEDKIMNTLKSRIEKVIFGENNENL